ncbi:hypothetical protein TNCV_575971 [Trichonephila clavipes]|nr:hypothetical protein TNCV_575971 [Trichonephila clavipes]
MRSTTSVRRTLLLPMVTYQNDSSLGDYTIRKGSTCVILIYFLHRDKEVFPDPERFDPDRFLPENAVNIPDFGFIPFSAGPRNFIGCLLRRNRRQYKQLTNFDRGRIIGLREAGWSNRRIGRHLGRSDMVVARCWQQWITEGRVYRREGQDVPGTQNDHEDRAIRRVATSAPTTSLASIQRHLPPSRHPVPSRENHKGDD